MRDSSEPTPIPLVSIILPTYNRAEFLRRSLASIQRQTFTDWELIVVDDGSTDDTSSLIDELKADVRQPVRYHWQENAGPASARNAGIDLARGRYVAFFDSDDEWLPLHLTKCVQALEANPHVDWVYAACRIVDDATGKVVVEHTFHVPGQPRAFLDLQTFRAGNLSIFEDVELTLCAIEHGIHCGLQSSVMRTRFCKSQRIPDFRIGEDQVYVVVAVQNGACLGYFDEVHVEYHVHDLNITRCEPSDGVAHRARNLRALIGAFEYLKEHVTLSPIERGELRRRLKNECFWNLGYATFWQSGCRREALQTFRRGLRYWPWDWRCWKTFIWCNLRSVFSRCGTDEVLV